MDIVTLIAVVALSAPAGRDAALAEEYLRLAHVTETFEAMAREEESELLAAVDDAPCDAVKPILRERNTEIARDARARLGSRQVHDRTVKLIQETFTDAELAQVNDALRSPGGRVLADKSPNLMVRLLDATHDGDEDGDRSAEALDAKYRTRFEAVRAQCEAQMPRESRDGRGTGRDTGRDDDRDYDRDDERDDDRRAP